MTYKKKSLILFLSLLSMTAKNSFCEETEKSSSTDVLTKLGNGFCSIGYKTIEGIPIIVVTTIIQQLGLHAIKVYFKPTPPSSQFDACSSLLDAALQAKQKGKRKCYYAALKQYRKKSEAITSLEPEKLNKLLDDILKLEKTGETTLSQWQEENYKNFVVGEKPISYQKFMSKYTKKTKAKI